MGILTDLASISKKIEERPAGFESVSDRELTRNIKSGSKRSIRFIQELDPEAKNYRDDLGTGLVVSEYQHPEQDLWFLQVVDTTDDEGECWAAENGWKSKLNLYVNVLDVDSGEVFYLARSVLGGLGADIIESAQERGTITDAVWTIKKSGEKMNTKYNLTLKDITSDEIEVNVDDLIDFRKSVLNEVPSDKQEEWAAQVEQRVRNKKAGGDAPATAGSDGDDEDVW